MQQRVDERVFLVAGGGMHDESGRFVDDEQRFVLEQDFQRNFLGQRLGGFGFGKKDFNRVARARRVRGFGRLAVHADVALLDQPLHRAARDGGKAFAEKRVEPHVGSRLLDGELFGARGHSVQFADCGTESFFQLIKKIIATPVQIAESATLKAGKSQISVVPRRAM